jgi:hypothetical protein
MLTQARRIAHMQTKNDRGRTMLTATQSVDQARSLSAALVERAERATRSRMAAYEQVASMVGVSSSWLRKLIGRQPGLSIEAHEFLNIAEAYRSICRRIEAEAELERLRFLAIGREADATAEGARNLGAVETASNVARKARS